MSIAQIRVTPEGYPLMPNKPSEVTLINTDTILVQKVDGIVRGIEFGDFKALLPTASGTDDQTGDEVPLNTTNFNGNLSALDDTVQKAFETLDEISSGAGTDDQNLTGASINLSNVLQIDIENGTSATVDLSQLANSGTDNQQVNEFQIVNDELRLSIENDGNPAYTVDLSPYVGGPTGGISTSDIDTFAELNTIVADETLSKASDIGVTIQPYHANTDTDSTDDVVVTGPQSIGGVKTFTESHTIIDNTVDGLATDDSYLMIKNSTLTGLGVSAGFGALYFLDDKIRFSVSDAVSGSSNNFGIDPSALTASQDLIVTDTDMTWNGISLLSGVSADNLGNHIATQGLNMNGNWISNVDYLQPNHLRFIVTDTEPTSTEGTMYSDLSESRLKYYDGTLWRALAYQDEIVGGSSLPTDDTTPLVQDPVDNTKQGGIDVGNVPTGTKATLSLSADNTFFGNLTSTATVRGQDVLINGDNSGDWWQLSPAVGDNPNLIFTAVDNNVATGSEFTFNSTTGNLTASGGFVKQGGTNDQILLADGTTSLLSEKIGSDATGYGAGVTTTDNIVVWDYDVNNTEPTAGPGDTVIGVNVPLAGTFSGTTIPLDNYVQKDDSTTDTATWTIDATPKNGAVAEIKLNLAAEPAPFSTDTGVSQLPGTTDFSASTDQLLTVKVILGTVYYYYTNL
ncbi:hypothetical protein DX873_17660 [Flagellimonas nanhaiensis]|uniref:Uncharacterized protein n=2 Tax=Flagellimonas nanhaiensis TaxID=2292706 RepID=A0A371JL93_9FLAO|nr:hypothetical protein DX873_17660 [Allomuricauda nanhaiensis]